jgi:NSS family neurotransmitter:Na+ symporter
MFGIVLYYSVIISWCCNYLMYSFNFAWGVGNENEFFHQTFLGLTSGPAELGQIQLNIIGALALVWFINWVIVYRGIQRGVEVANKIFMPLLFMLTFALVVWSVSLEGAGAGLVAYLKPDLSKLSNFKVWSDAFGQIFFSLSLGFGIMIAYASYLPEKADVTLNAIITCVVNSFYSVFAGLAVFATLGYISHTTGLPIGQILKQGIGLAFVVYPKAIGMLPGYGQVFGVIFFLCLVVAGISSSISIIEAFTCAILDKFPVLRRSSIVTVLCILGFMGGIIFTTGGGLYWLDIIDHFLNNYALVIVGLAECIVAGWVARIEPLREYINEISEVGLRRLWDHVIRYLVPIILCVIIFGAIRTDLLAPYGGYPGSYIVMIGVGKLVLTVVLAVILYKLPSTAAEFEEG